MNFNDNIRAKGQVLITVIGPNGEVKEKRFIPNLVVTVGKEFIASRMVGVASAVMSHMAVGTNAVAPVSGDTALGTEVGRVALSSGIATGASVTYTATFGAGVGTGALTEAGLFNAGAAGSMLARTTFAVVNKGAGDSISISWTISII